MAFMLPAHLERCVGKYWDGADLVVEILSESHRTTDLETKRIEYARAGIPEYWIVDPRERSVTRLALKGAAYELADCFVGEGRLASAVVLGWSVDVEELFAAE